MKRVRGIWTLLLMLIAASAWAADVTGKWSGSMSLNDSNPAPAFAILKQDGAVVTGTMGPSEDKQFPITRGQIEGDQVTIEARPGPAVLRLTMKVEPTKLTGEVFEDDQKIGTVSMQKLDK